MADTIIHHLSDTPEISTEGNGKFVAHQDVIRTTNNKATRLSLGKFLNGDKEDDERCSLDDVVNQFNEESIPEQWQEPTQYDPLCIPSSHTVVDKDGNEINFITRTAHNIIVIDQQGNRAYYGRPQKVDGNDEVAPGELAQAFENKNHMMPMQPHHTKMVQQK